MGYGGSTACAVAGISYRQLDYWARTGLVGPGLDRLYSFRDIVALKMIKRLLDAGVSLQIVRRAIATLRERGENDLSSLTLVSDGRTVYEYRSPDEIIDLLRGGQGVFAVAVSSAVNGTQGSMSGDPVGIPAPVPVDELTVARARRRTAI